MLNSICNHAFVQAKLFHNYATKKWICTEYSVFSLRVQKMSASRAKDERFAFKKCVWHYLRASVGGNTPLPPLLGGNIEYFLK